MWGAGLGGGWWGLQRTQHLALGVISMTHTLATSLPPVPRCDVDVRKDLYGNVVLTGGTAGFAGLRDRLEKELADLAPQMAKVKVRCCCMAARCAGVEWQCRAKRLVDGAAGWRGAKLTWHLRWPRSRCV